MFGIGSPRFLQNLEDESSLPLIISSTKYILDFFNLIRTTNGFLEHMTPQQYSRYYVLDFFNM